MSGSFKFCESREFGDTHVLFVTLVTVRSLSEPADFGLGCWSGLVVEPTCTGLEALDP